MKPTPQISIDPITSDQQGLHPDLNAVIARHLNSAWRKPIPEHTQLAATDALLWLESLGNPPVILDSFCGTGMSTAELAARYSHCAVIGVDKSADRLNRHVASSGNYRLFRAECEPFWQSLVNASIRLERHHLLYPNPWPKGRQLKRRIHGHPAFPLLARLGGVIELRTNWEIYAREFHASLAQLGFTPALETIDPEAPITLFERKYQSRKQTLWQVTTAAHT